jgi:hypothetical protein
MMLDIAPSSSRFRASIMNVALALRGGMEDAVGGSGEGGSGLEGLREGF